MEYELTIGEMKLFAMKLPTHKHHCLVCKFKDEDCLYKVGLFDSETDARWFMEALAEQINDFYTRVR